MVATPTLSGDGTATGSVCIAQQSKCKISTSVSVQRIFLFSVDPHCREADLAPIVINGGIVEAPFLIIRAGKSRERRKGQSRLPLELVL